MKVPIGKAFAETYSFVWHNRLEALKRTPLPLAAMIVLMWALMRAGMGGGGLVVIVLASLAVIALVMRLAVAWHRLVLFGSEAAGAPLGVRFGVREFKFFGLSLLVKALEKLTEELTDAVFESSGETAGLIAAIVLFVLFFYLFIRLFLVLPAIAADHRPAFPRAWELSRGRALGLFGALLAVFAPLFVVGAGIFMLVALLQVPVIILVVFPAFYLCIVVVFATFLSTVYLGLGGPEAEA